MRDWNAILKDADARGLSQSQIAREQKCNPVSVHDAMKLRGLLPWPHNGRSRFNWDAILKDADARALTQAQIAQEQKCSLANVYDVMRRRGLLPWPHKNRSETNVA